MAIKPDRSLRRAAEGIHERLSESGHGQPDLRISEHSWQQLLRCVKLLRVAHEHGWTASERKLRPRVSRLLGETIDELCKLRSAIEPELTNAQPPTLGNVWREVAALPEEFDEARYDAEEQSLSAVTPPITLDGVGLGRFKISLELSKLGAAHPYRVVALDPSPAQTNSSVTHPHVQDEALCEGEGGLAIRRALEQGRVYDFFVLVRQILETYNAGSAYVSLDDWQGTSCRDCGYVTPAEESVSCDHCGSSVCSDCSRGCESCWRYCCSECGNSCSKCDNDYCPACLRACNGCDETFCNQCLEGGRCESCRADEEEHHEEPEDASPPDSEGEELSKTEVHALCVGEAAVSPGSG